MDTISEYRVHYSFDGAGHDMTVVDKTGDDAKKMVEHLIPGAIVTGVEKTGAFKMEQPVAELQIPLAMGRYASIPYPMSAEDFELLVATLNLWKRKLVKDEPDDHI